MGTLIDKSSFIVISLSISVDDVVGSEFECLPGPQAASCGKVFESLSQVESSGQLNSFVCCDTSNDPACCTIFDRALSASKHKIRLH